MTGLWIALAFVVWYALSLYLSERFASKSKLAKQFLFFVSFVFSPVVLVLVLILSRK
jgi:fumarate reductase subunit C